MKIFLFPSHVFAAVWFALAASLHAQSNAAPPALNNHNTSGLDS